MIRLIPCRTKTRTTHFRAYRNDASGGLLARLGLDEHPHDVALLHDQVLDAVDLDLGARPFSEQHAVPGLHVDRDELAVLVAAARTDGDDGALRRLLLRGIGN